MRIKITVSYDGTNYSGWQIQPNAESVQQTLEEAIEKVVGAPVKVTGSGRTDAGVHAKAQIAHFDTEKENIPPQRFFKAINTFLPSDIRVLNSEQASESFDARKSAKRKTYCYSLYFGEVEQPLKERYSTFIERQPDLSLMREAAKKFIGQHDFKCMCASGSGAKTTVRTIYDIEITNSENDISVKVTGNGFLYNMVRILVGTLLEVGYKKLSVKDVEEMLFSGERAKCGKTLSAKGLCLERVVY